MICRTDDCRIRDDLPQGGRWADRMIDILKWVQTANNCGRDCLSAEQEGAE